MRTIFDWKDLEPEGIVVLTGESCAYGYRLLCDVNARGLDLLARLLGARSDLDRLKRAAVESLTALVALLPEDDPRDLECQTVGDFVEMAEPLILPDSWNAQAGMRWSVMLPREMFRPLAVFALIRAGCRDIFAFDGDSVSGFGETEAAEREASLKHWRAEQRRFRYVQNPGFARNLHVVSGRAE